MTSPHLEGDLMVGLDVALADSVADLCQELGMPRTYGSRTYAAFRILQRGQRDGMSDDLIVFCAKRTLSGEVLDLTGH